MNSGFLGGLAERSGHLGEKDLSVHQRHQICDFVGLKNWSFGCTHIGETVIVVLMEARPGIPGFGKQVEFVLVCSGLCVSVLDLCYVVLCPCFPFHVW